MLSTMSCYVTCVLECSRNVRLEPKGYPQKGTVLANSRNKTLDIILRLESSENGLSVNKDTIELFFIFSESMSWGWC